MLDITWLGHGTFEFKLETGEVVIIDPWLEGNNPAYPKGYEITRCDHILVTHGHYDHIQDCVPLANKFNARVICIFETAHWLQSKGVQNVSGMNKGGTQDVGPLRVSMTHAIHSCGILDEGKIIYGGEAAGYIIKLPDDRIIYFSGDTTVFSDMALIAEIYQPTLAMLPVGDMFTMDPRQAAIACRLLKVETVIPMHFGTMKSQPERPGEFQELVRHLGTKVWALTPGQTQRW